MGASAAACCKENPACLSATGVPCNEGVVSEVCGAHEERWSDTSASDVHVTVTHIGSPDEASRGAGLRDARDVKAIPVPQSEHRPKQMEMREQQDKQSEGERAATAPSSGQRKDTVDAPSNRKSRWKFGERLDNAATLDQTWWTCYCIFCGCGSSTEALRPIEWLSTCLCCETRVRSAECTGRFDGVCSCMQTCIGCTALAIMPPHQAHPRWLCCSQSICGKHGGHTARRDHSLEWIEYDGTLEQFVPCYACCCGCAGVPDVIALAATYLKCCCCTCKNDVVMPDTGSLCVLLLNCWCLMGQCHLPPNALGNPFCACCGRRYIPVS